MKKSFLFGWGVCLILALSSRVLPQTREDCLGCHSDKTLTKEKEGKQVSIYVDDSVLNKSPHRKLVCIACHAGFDPQNVPHKAKIEPVNCLKCHSNAPVKHEFHPQLARSINAHEQPDVSCKDCHGRHDVVSPKVAGSKFNERHIAEGCGECHADVREAFDSSAHGRARASGISVAPNCLTCHRSDISGIDGGRDTLGYKVAQAKLCLSCHLDNPEVRGRTSPSAGFIAAYENSVHGAALLGGNSRAANCVDCHGSHEMKKGLEASAKVNKMHIPQTCSKCHESVAIEYSQSVHGMAVAKGNIEAPVCTDCHGEHSILRHTDPRSPVSVRNLSQQVCSPCHSSLALSTKYGLSTDRFKTFSDSYHGLALRGGSVEVANCASCHGSHGIKPSSDPTSTISKANLVSTCGKCHPGANARFTVGSVHVTLAEKEDPLLYWIATMYIILIVTLIGGMFIHNLMDFLRKSRRKLAVRQGLIAEGDHGHSLYVRMNLSERLQHGALLASFTILVITGFMLRFPEAWWVKGIRSLSDSVFDLRSFIHRTAAVVMILAGLYHLWYVSFTKTGRRLLFDLLPRLQDARDALGVLKYNFGFSDVKPLFGRFSYIEKSEYWALVWGTVVMAATGCIMWFDNTFIGLLTKLGYDVSRTVHYYEAWLATLAIIVWHIYFVIFNPDVYPINLAFWRGTLTEEEMAEEHPLELVEIKRREFMEDILEEDLPSARSVESGEKDGGGEADNEKTEND